MVDGVRSPRGGITRTGPLAPVSPRHGAAEPRLQGPMGLSARGGPANAALRPRVSLQVVQREAPPQSGPVMPDLAAAMRFNDIRAQAGQV